MQETDCKCDFHSHSHGLRVWFLSESAGYLRDRLYIRTASQWVTFTQRRSVYDDEEQRKAQFLYLDARLHNIDLYLRKYGSIHRNTGRKMINNLMVFTTQTQTLLQERSHH